jgi:hypothetical protein
VPLATGSTRFWDAVQDKQIVTNGSADPGNHYINIKLLYWLGHILSFLAISVLISWFSNAYFFAADNFTTFFEAIEEQAGAEVSDIKKEQRPNQDVMKEGQ